MIGRALGPNFVTRLPVMFGSKLPKSSDWHRVSEAVPPMMSRSWPWRSQIKVKKIVNLEIVVRRCFVNRSVNVSKIHKKTPAPECAFSLQQNWRETPAQVFSSKFCKISILMFYTVVFSNQNNLKINYLENYF